MQLTRAEALGYDVSRFAHGMCVGPIAREGSRPRDPFVTETGRRVLIPDENTQLEVVARPRGARGRAPSPNARPSGSVRVEQTIGQPGQKAPT